MQGSSSQATRASEGRLVAMPGLPSLPVTPTVEQSAEAWQVQDERHRRGSTLCLNT